MAFITLPDEVSRQAFSDDYSLFLSSQIHSFIGPFKADVTVEHKPSGCMSFSRTNKRVWAGVTAGAEGFPLSICPRTEQTAHSTFRPHKTVIFTVSMVSIVLR